MNNPHEVLGLEPGAPVALVRKRYLELVREFPPEREPEKFARIHAAYRQLEDPTEALYNRLFVLDDTDESWEDLTARVRRRLLRQSLQVRGLIDLADDE
jgi:curved DNA-binding protein CbpA